MPVPLPVVTVMWKESVVDLGATRTEDQSVRETQLNSIQPKFVLILHLRFRFQRLLVRVDLQSVSGFY